MKMYYNAIYLYIYIYNILYRPTIVFTGNHFFLGGEKNRTFVRCFFDTLPHSYCLGASCHIGGSGEGWLRPANDAASVKLKESLEKGAERYLAGNKFLKHKKTVGPFFVFCFVCLFVCFFLFSFFVCLFVFSFCGVCVFL